MFMTSIRVVAFTLIAANALALVSAPRAASRDASVDPIANAFAVNIVPVSYQGVLPTIRAYGPGY